MVRRLPIYWPPEDVRDSHASNIVPLRGSGFSNSNTRNNDIPGVDAESIRKGLVSIIKAVDQKKLPGPLHPSVQSLQHLLEGDARLMSLCTSMLQESRPSKEDAEPHLYIRDYKHLLRLLDHVIARIPFYEETAIVGLAPIRVTLDAELRTTSGYWFFIDERVNLVMKDITNAYGQLLTSLASCVVLGREKSEMFGPSALHAVMRTASCGDTTFESRKFEDVFVCNPQKEWHGFQSWDDWFTRRYRPGVRPVEGPHDDSVVINACEASPYCVETNVAFHCRYWAKGDAYSLLELFDGDVSMADEFEGGTIMQAFLSALSYHRWHAPCSGTIVKVQKIQGTYYSEPLRESGEAPNGHPGVNQVYLAMRNTRTNVYIQAPGVVGLMCLMFIGVSDVSSCELTVKVGDIVTKGQDIGAFHFGGSTYCCVFRPGLQLELNPKFFTKEAPYLRSDRDHVNMPVCSALARIR